MQQATQCDPGSHPARKLILFLVCAGTSIGTFDISSVNIALPTITDYFGTTLGVAQWTVISYMLMISALLLTFGRLGDILGRAKLYTIGLLIFVVSAAIAGASTGIYMLIAARVMQGVGSAITMSCGPALVSEVFPANKRGKALGIVSTSVAIGLFIGPAVSGQIVSFFGWRYIFFATASVGIPLIVAMIARVGRISDKQNTTLDTPGSVLIAITVISTILALNQIGSANWLLSGALFTVAIASAVVLVGVEKRAVTAIVPPSFMRLPSVKAAGLSAVCIYAAIMPVLVYLPFYCEQIMGLDKKTVGLILSLGPLTSAAISPFTGSLSDKIGTKVLTISGLVLTGLGAFLMTGLTPETSFWGVVFRLILVTAGGAVFVAPNTSSIIGSVGCNDIGVASGIVALARNVGMVTGTTLAGVVLTYASVDFTQNGFHAAMLACTISASCGMFISFFRKN